MKFCHFHRATRGQGLVEFAMVLPLLVLLLVMAVDFGRVFFGWVALQNTARIGADFAAQHWDAWPDDPGGDQARADYLTVMENDLQAANCAYATPLPEPVFEDIDSPPDGLDWGDLVSVTITCDFALITPLADDILGGPVTLTASSTFALHGTATGSLPSPPPIPCQEPVAVLGSTPEANNAGRILINGGTGLVVDFTMDTPETSTCQIDVVTWTVNPDDGTGVENGDDLQYTFPPHVGGGRTDYTVQLTIQTSEGTDTDTVTVRVSQ